MKRIRIPGYLLLAGGWSAAAAAPQRFDLGNGVALEVGWVPKGRFLMGSPESEAGRNADETPHEVILTRDFFLGRTAVTKAQWQRFATETGYRSEAQTGTSGGFGWNGIALEQKKEFTWENPGYPQTPDHPAVLVTWDDSQAYLKWLSRRTGWTFELPTEAQWEYACRAGTTTAWWPAADAVRAGRGIWSKESAGNHAHPVAELPANPWDLHIAGNVWEWCADWYGPYSLLHASDPLQRNAPASDKPRRVLRGGSWLRPLKDSRSATRYRNDPKSRNADNGFRVMSYGKPAAPVQATPPVERPDPAPADALPPPQPAGPSVLHPESRDAPPAKTGFPWLWVLLGGAAVVWLIRRLQHQPVPPVADSRVNPATPPPLPQGRAFTLTPGTILTKPTNDGFWLNAGYAIGTLLDVTWREGDQIQQRRIPYEPGNDGHFIYTGVAPEDVQVTASESPTIAPMALRRPPGNDPGDHGRPDQRFRPSAY